MKSEGQLTIEELGEFLAKLAEKSESVYWLSNPDFSRIIYVSPAYEKIWGYPREVLYQSSATWMDHLAPDDIKCRNHPLMAEQIASFGPDARIEEVYKIIRADGKFRWILDRCFPIYNEANECLAVSGVAIDITDDKQAEEALKKAKEEAESAFAEMEKMNEGLKLIAASIAHELRTPLSAISSAMKGILKYLPQLLTTYQIAKDNRLQIPYIPSYRVELLNKINNQIQREIESSHLIIDMLLMKIQQPNTIKSDFQIYSIVACINEAIKRYPLATEDKILIHWTPDTDFHFKGKSALIIHVFFNLIKNALYYVKNTDKGEITISLASDSDFNKVYFKDTGKGIAPEILPHIFERFYSKTTGGAGIGLAFCKQVLQEIGGDINCQSIEHEFTQFEILFPPLS